MCSVIHSLCVFLDKHEWMQPVMQGKIPPARGVHTATVVGDQLLLYGGSSDFDEETMQCQQYYNDCFIIPTGTVWIPIITLITMYVVLLL